MRGRLRWAWMCCPCEGGEADPLGDMCPPGREGDLDVMDVLDREGDPDVTDVHRHGGGPVPRLVAHWLGSCEVSDPSWFHSSSADSSGPKGPIKGAIRGFKRVRIFE